MIRGGAFTLIALLGLPALARAQEACGPLKIVDIVHMIPVPAGNADIVPVIIGGKPRSFLLDTGGYRSQISRTLAQEQNLAIMQNGELFDATGNVSRDQVHLPEYSLGEIKEKDTYMVVSPSQGIVERAGLDGSLSLDQLAPYDVELDFGTDTLNLFSPDHCPGHVVYWNPSAVAAMPISLQRTFSPRERRGVNVFMSVMLDGHPVKAVIDTGATNTALRLDLAEQLYGLSMGSADTPEVGGLNGNVSLKTYTHRFKSLSFGDVKIANVPVWIIPNAMARNVDPAQLVGDRTKTERDRIVQPEMLLGMDVLRSLHIYIAFAEKKIYISPASPPSLATVQPYGPDYMAAMLKRLDTMLAESPNDAATLNDRCFWRGIAKTDLDGALADCDLSLKLEPGIAAVLDSRAFVLFQQGKYQDALAAYNAALAVDPHQAPSLLMRGYTRAKLGDQAGKDADTASAKADDPNIETEFKRIGING